MEKKLQKTPLEKTLYHSFLLLSTLIIFISLTITLYFDISRQRKDMDRVISGTAAYIASMPEISEMLEHT